MRYILLAIVVVAVLAIVVPSVYKGLDVEGESHNASFTLSTPPTLVPEPAGSSGAVRTPVATEPPAAGGAALGQQVAARSGCTACHSINGSVLVGPSWKGLAGHEVTLTGGQKVTADDAYLHESIVSPNAKVVDGFQPGIMPQDFGTRLSEDEIQAVIAYIHTIE
jgi:cytochrome c oxidase subunit 2